MASEDEEYEEQRWDKVAAKFIKEFSLEIKKFLNTATDLIAWYPREVGKRHLQIVITFVFFIVGIVGVMGYLT